MQYCTECNSVEQGTIEIEVDGETMDVCAVCQMTEDTMRNFDEDAYKDR
jgi:hypothetical protein